MHPQLCVTTVTTNNGKRVSHSHSLSLSQTQTHTHSLSIFLLSNFREYSISLGSRFVDKFSVKYKLSFSVSIKSEIKLFSA